MSKLATRQAAINALNSVKNALDGAGASLTSVAETYNELHPEIGQPLYEAAALVLEMLNVVEAVRKLI